MIPLKQIGASLPPDSENTRLIVRVINFNKFKTILSGFINVTNRQTDDLPHDDRADQSIEWQK